MSDENEKQEDEVPKETDILLEHAVEVLLRYFQPTEVKKGAELMSIHKITEKLNDVIPGVNEGIVCTALQISGFKIEMLPESFDFYWMLRMKK